MNYTPQFNADDDEELEEMKKEFQELLDELLEENPDAETITATNNGIDVFEIYLAHLDRYIYVGLWYINGVFVPDLEEI